MKTIRRLINEFVNFLLVICLLVLGFLLVYRYVAQPFSVQGNSMEPTLSNKDRIIMDKTSDIGRFDIVVFPDPMGLDQSYVKRIIALPGDRLESFDNTIYLNGAPLDEPYLSDKAYTENFSLWDTVGVETIPNGYVFVMGDNRQNSGDSRQFGLVPIDSIKGQASFRFYPFEDWGYVNKS